MKRLPFVLLPLLIISAAYGQSTELSVHLNSGLFSFDGNSTVKYSTLIVHDVGPQYFIQNPYSSQETFSYGFGVELQRVTEGHFLFGGQLAYERLLLMFPVNFLRVAIPQLPENPRCCSISSICIPISDIGLISMI